MGQIQTKPTTSAKARYGELDMFLVPGSSNFHRSSIKLHSTECMEALIQAGANVNIRDNWQQTCIFAVHFYLWAAAFVPYLIRAGADVNAREEHRRSALFLTSWGSRLRDVTDLEGGHAKSAYFLFQAHADPNVQDTDGFTPLMAAVHDSAHKIVKALLTARPNLKLLSNTGKTVLHIAAKFADVNTLHALTKSRLQG